MVSLTGSNVLYLDVETTGRTEHYLCRLGSTATVKRLLDHGADMEMRMTGGWIPAHCAAEGGHVVVLRLLMEYKCPMNVQDDLGDTPVNIATVYGHKDVVMLLQKAIK